MFCRSFFVLFLLVIVLSVVLRYTDSDYLPSVSSSSSVLVIQDEKNLFIVMILFFSLNTCHMKKCNSWIWWFLKTSENRYPTKTNEFI